MIIKCPECGHQVSDKAPLCPSCGIEIAGHIITCPNCGEIYLSDEKTCPNCHHANVSTLNKIENQEGNETPTVIPTDGNNKNDIPLVSPISQKTQEQATDFSEPTAENNEVVIAQIIPDEDNVEHETSNATNEHSASKHKKKNYHIALLVSILIAIAISVILLQLYNHGLNNNEKKEYEIAIKSNNEAVLQQYLDEFPEAPGDHRKSIQTRLDNMQKTVHEHMGVRSLKSWSECYEYLQQNQSSPYKTEIERKMDDFAWSDALRINTADSYSEYKERMPNGKHNHEADERIKAFMKNTATPEEKSKAVSCIREFLRGINAKSTTKISNAIASPFNFLGTSGATITDVTEFMRNKLYQADVKTLNWHLDQPSDISTETNNEDETIIQRIEIPAKLVIKREGGTSTKSYLISATIKNGKITAINWK